MTQHGELKVEAFECVSGVLGLVWLKLLFMLQRRALRDPRVNYDQLRGT